MIITSQTNSSTPTLSSSSSSHVTQFSNGGSLRELAPTGVSAWSGPQVANTGSHGDSEFFRFRVPLCGLAAPDNTLPFTLGNSYPGLLLSTKGSYAASATSRMMESVALGPMILAAIKSYTQTGTNYCGNWAAFLDCSLPGFKTMCYSKYRIRHGRIKLSYIPQTTTVDPAAFALCFTDDPMHPQMGMAAYIDGRGSNFPSFATTKNSTNSVVFACWSTWEREFKVDPDTIYYTSTNISRHLSPSHTVSDTAPFEGADLRLSHFGQLTCFANGNSGIASNLVKGELFLEMELELFDLVPVAGSAALPFTLEEFARLSGWVPMQEALLSIVGEDSDDDKSESKSSKMNFMSSYGYSRPRGPPTLERSGLYKLFSKGKVSPTPAKPVEEKYKFLKVAARERLRTTSSSPIKRTTLVVKPPLSMKSCIKHLSSNIDRLPKAAHPHIGQLLKLKSSKGAGWVKPAKKVIKTLVKEVPVVGSILSELTDVVGDDILGWISKLF